MKHSSLVLAFVKISPSPAWVLECSQKINMKESQRWLNQNPFCVSNICRESRFIFFNFLFFCLAAHICSILMTQNYRLHWWDAIYIEMMFAKCPASPCDALSVTVSVLIFEKASSGRWRRDPIWTESQRYLNGILWVEYFDRFPDFWVLMLIIAVIVVLIVFVVLFFFPTNFFFPLIFPNPFVISGPVLTLSPLNKTACVCCNNLIGWLSRHLKNWQIPRYHPEIWTLTLPLVYLGYFQSKCIGANLRRLQWDAPLKAAMLFRTESVGWDPFENVHSPSLGISMSKDEKWMYIGVYRIRWCLKTVNIRLRIELLGWALALTAKKQS